MAQADLFWPQVLPLVLLGPRIGNRKKFATSPAEVMYGGNLRLPSDSVLDLRSLLNITGLLCLLKK